MKFQSPEHVVAEIADDFLGGDSLLKEPEKGWFQFLLFKLLLKDLCNTTVRSLVGLALMPVIMPPADTSCVAQEVKAWEFSAVPPLLPVAARWLPGALCLALQ